MKEFLISSLSRTGADTMITPREIIRDYVTLLDLLFTNTDRTFADIAGTMTRSTVSSAMDQADAPAENTGAEPASGTAEKKKVTIDELEF